MLQEDSELFREQLVAEQQAKVQLQAQLQQLQQQLGTARRRQDVMRSSSVGQAAGGSTEHFNHSSSMQHGGHAPHQQLALQGNGQQVQHAAKAIHINRYERGPTAANSTQDSEAPGIAHTFSEDFTSPPPSAGRTFPLPWQQQQQQQQQRGQQSGSPAGRRGSPLSNSIALAPPMHTREQDDTSSSDGGQDSWAHQRPGSGPVRTSTSVHSMLKQSRASAAAQGGGMPAQQGQMQASGSYSMQSPAGHLRQAARQAVLNGYDSSPSPNRTGLPQSPRRQHAASQDGMAAGSVLQHSALQSHQSGAAAGQRERSMSSSREGRITTRPASEAPATRPVTGKPAHSTVSRSPGELDSGGSDDEHVAGPRYSRVDGTMIDSSGRQSRQGAAAADRPSSAPGSGSAGRLGKGSPAKGSILAGKAAQVTAKAGMLQAPGAKADSVFSPWGDSAAEGAGGALARTADAMTAKLQALSQTYRGMRSKRGKE